MRGLEVGAREAVELRDAILQVGDLRQPVNFNEQLMKNSQTVLDNEVSQSLIQLLSTKRSAQNTATEVSGRFEGGIHCSIALLPLSWPRIPQNVGFT